MLTADFNRVADPRSLPCQKVDRPAQHLQVILQPSFFCPAIRGDARHPTKGAGVHHRPRPTHQHLCQTGKVGMSGIASVFPASNRAVSHEGQAWTPLRMLNGRTLTSQCDRTRPQAISRCATPAGSVTLATAIYQRVACEGRVARHGHRGPRSIAPSTVAIRKPLFTSGQLSPCT